MCSGNATGLGGRPGGAGALVLCTARLRPGASPWVFARSPACCCRNSDRALRSWSAVDGALGVAVSGGVGVLSCRPWAACGVMVGCGLVVSGGCPPVLLLAVRDPIVAAGYGVDCAASCCVAFRASVVVAAGVRSAMGHIWKRGPRVLRPRAARGAVPARVECWPPCWFLGCHASGARASATVVERVRPVPSSATWASPWRKSR